MKKSIFKSKTLWINILMALVMVLPEFFNLPSVKIPVEISSFIILIVNVILRFITKEAAGLTSKTE